MADSKVDIGKIAKLIELGRELQEKQAAVLDEIDAIIGGKAGIGADMKAVQAAFSAAWSHRYAPGFGDSYVWNHRSDAPQVKRLIKRLGVEEIVRRAAVYIRNEDPFYVSRRHSFPLFVSSINSHADNSAPVAAAPVGCKHDPPCESDAEHTRRRTSDMRATEQDDRRWNDHHELYHRKPGSPE